MEELKRSLKEELLGHHKIKKASSVETSVVEVEKLLKERKKFEYGKKETWDERYSQSEAEFEWLCSWNDELKNAINVKAGSRILHVGCGTSTLGVEMVRNGYQVTNTDYSEIAIQKMVKKYPQHIWCVADGTSMAQFSDNAFDAVVEKGTLDALACAGKERKKLCQMLIQECSRVAKMKVVSICFGQPETRLEFLPTNTCIKELKIPPRSDKVYVYSFQPPSFKARSKKQILLGLVSYLRQFVVIVMLVSWLIAYISSRKKIAAMVQLLHSAENKSDSFLTSLLEPSPGTARCNYELLRDFAILAHDLNWTLGAGTLLGALRSDPPGLLPWEHDVDIYIDGPSAFRLLEDRIAKIPQNSTLDFRGFVDHTGQPCCGFGWKFFHHYTSVCELDVLVLSLSPYAPLIHGETRLWPPWGSALAMIKDMWFRHVNPRFLVIPEDIDHKSLCINSNERWDRKRNSFIGGPHLSYFQNEYFDIDEFYPIQSLTMYDLSVQLPNNPWASLNRTYGNKCARFARLDTFGHIELDLHYPIFSRLSRPSQFT
uniref:Methyltransferase type 11 domain-containing protein n=1 Tax=Aureoumbra lagunensis TaxID=44058 RepID=A0A7S3JZ52_9STRA|mmetsp:Transcript_4606/g.6930  ORF Transcript_4606/g.6930 Transcript_4606/m.6930 type:complete len:542 (+) Transcript_4606:40-1665(+)